MRWNIEQIAVHGEISDKKNKLPMTKPKSENGSKQENSGSLGLYAQ